MKPLTLNSYAKLNLYLEVLNKRKDKFHNIRTIFERIDLCDKIILKKRKKRGIKITCADKHVPKGADNLCYRSASLLMRHFNIPCGVDIKIAKRIPVGAGLGGGSSNAAAVLIGLNRLFNLKLTQRQLARFSAKIGSDCAFFVYNVPFGIGKGRGERITPLKTDLRLWHILVVPKIHVSTPLIYARWDKYSKLTPPFLNSRSKKIERAGLTRPAYDVNILSSGLSKRRQFDVTCALFNSLEPVTISLYPEVKKVKSSLAGLGIKSILMSGSGPATFGIVSSRKEALVLSKKLKIAFKGWRVYLTRTF